MKSKLRIDVTRAPLSKTVLAARRYRLELRRREALIASLVLSAAFVFALWASFCSDAVDTIGLGRASAFGLALLLGCVLHALALNCVERAGLLPAIASQLARVEAARGAPAVDAYLSAVEAQKRDLNRKEAVALIKHGQLTAGSVSC